MSDAILTALSACRARIAAAAGARPVTLVAVAKTRPAADVRLLAAQGVTDIGENYLREALAKQADCADLVLAWHFIGALQSNKSREVARHFDWLHSLDRERLVAPLARARPADRPPLNVLIQVNVDDEAGKAGCRPEAIAALAAAVAAEPRLRLRGLMALPDPARDPAVAFAHMAALQRDLARQHAGIDTLSMGMSADYELAIRHGATMVRIGSALFGPRPRHPGAGATADVALER